jgi:hypothetical protein
LQESEFKRLTPTRDVIALAGYFARVVTEERSMSLAIFPVFEKSLAGSDAVTDGSALAYCMTELEEVAQHAKLKPLSAFADSRPTPADFVGDPNDLLEEMGESNEWFDAAEGRDAVRTLAEHVQTCPRVEKLIEDREGVLEDFKELAEVLNVAAKEKIRFRLELG